MSDFEKQINASDLIEWIIETDPDWCVGSVRCIIDHIDKMPSAQPIHCKDCKHRVEHKHYGDLGESAYTCEGNMVGWILPDDYCSYAERRTDGV